MIFKLWTMFEVNYIRGKYNKCSATPLMRSIVFLYSHLKSCLGEVFIRNPVMLYLCVVSFLHREFTILCCCKDCKNVKRDKKFLQSRLFYLFFMPLQVLTWNIRRFLSLGPESFISSNIRNFLRVSSFYFSSSESWFLKYKEVFRFPKHKKKLSLEEM